MSNSQHQHQHLHERQNTGDAKTQKMSMPTGHHQMMLRDYRRRFIIATVLTVPVLLLSPLIQNLLGLQISFPGDMYLLALISSFVFFYCGWPFLRGFVAETKKRQPGMMTLIALAIAVAYLYSMAVVFGLKGKFFFWELVTLLDVMLLGHWLEMRSIIGASRALEKLAQLMPSTAHLLKDGEVVEVEVGKLSKGDRVLIKAGEKLPADGLVVKGTGYIDESMLTGESKPVKKGPGDKLIGGSVNGDSVFEITVESTGADSYLAKVINLVQQAQSAKSKTQRLADQAAMWLTIIAVTVGITTFAAWLIYKGDFAFAVERMATVMVITCPHALGLAIPLVVAVSTALSAKSGLLIRDRTAFENSRRITTVVFDKTGTLTEGKFGVKQVVPLRTGQSVEKIIQLAAALEVNSEHPIAKGILDRAKELNLDKLQVDDFKVLKGEGVEGRVDGTNVKVVSPAGLKKAGLEPPADFQADEAATNIFVVADEKLLGVISLADKIREESYPAVKKLQGQGVECWMLTGDNRRIAAEVAGALNLNGFFAEVLPHQKQEKIKELQAKGEFVAMTGDGINDAPALAQADVGIAIGSGTDIAAETADIILVNSNPLDVYSLILFGKATYRKMWQNLFWATGYNVVAVPLAAGVLYNAGIIISPALGAAFMSLSTIIVAVNARLLTVKR